MKTTKYMILPSGILLFLLLFTVPVLAAKGPVETMKPVLAELTKLLNDPNLQGAAHKVERRREIMSTIKSGFDFQEMCKRVLGRTWRNINEAQREHFTDLMTKLLENVYIGKLEDYHYRTIEYVEERIQDDRAQVTTLVEKGESKLPVHYILQNTQNGWMVYDINIAGVSLVRNYMEQFRNYLRTNSFDKLVKLIEEKNKTFEKASQSS